MRKKICLISLMVVLPLVVVNAWGAPFAYITNGPSQNVSVIDTATNTVVATVPIGLGTSGVAVDPSGTRVYVCGGGNKVYVIDTATNTVIGAPIPVGTGAIGLAINPSGTRVYVANQDSNNVSVIDTATNTVIGAPIPVGTGPEGVAVNPAGTRVYIANYFSYDVYIIDTATNTVVGTPVHIGANVMGIAVNPAGTRIYVATNLGISIIETENNTLIGSPIQVGLGGADGLAINPAGTRVYVTNFNNNDVFVIDTSTNTIIGTPIPVGTHPLGVAVNPAGTRVYVANYGSNNVSVIDTATNTVIGAPIPVGTNPWAFGQFIGPAVLPGEGTIGAEVTIVGSGFGAKKGKALLGTAALKILEWTDESVQCQLTKALPAGPYDVTIQPQAKGSSPIIFANGFMVNAPEIDSVNPTSGSVNDQITINGFFYGTTRGKVTLGGKTCRVVSWKMDSATGESEILFVVPRGLSSGAQELKVTNGVGADTINFTVK